MGAGAHVMTAELLPLRPSVNTHFEERRRQAYEQALLIFADESLDMLSVARGEVVYLPDTLTLAQRAWMEGTLAAIEELAEKKRKQ